MIVLLFLAQAAVVWNPVAVDTQQMLLVVRVIVVSEVDIWNNRSRASRDLYFKDYMGNLES